MKKHIVCNYAVIRFLPYPETGEFVNVGVLTACPQLKTIDYRLETKRRDRIADFFPELDMDVFTEGRKNFRQEMERLRKYLNRNEPGQLEFRIQEKEFHAIFREIVKPRESIFRFSNVGTVMAEDAQNELEALYKYYVERQFATHEEYQETVMANCLRKRFKAEDVLKYYHEQKFGNDEYGIKLPFVREIEANGRYKAIRPLHLDKTDTTKIFEHGDRWCARIRRLRNMKSFPAEMLFVVRTPKSGKKTDAAKEVVKELENLHTIVLPENEDDSIMRFATAV